MLISAFRLQFYKRITNKMNLVCMKLLIFIVFDLTINIFNNKFTLIFNKKPLQTQ